MQNFFGGFGIEFPVKEIMNQPQGNKKQNLNKKNIPKVNNNVPTKKGLTIALKQVVDKLQAKPDIVLVDALREIDTLGIPYQSIIKGDATCYSIACSSIIAKVTRDRIMREYDDAFPEYGFAKHKGYGTKEHIEAIKKYGPCLIHRKSFITHFI